MREDPETDRSRSELLRHVRMLKIRIAAQEDELSHMRGEVQRLAAEVMGLPDAGTVEANRPVPQSTDKASGPVPQSADAESSGELRPPCSRPPEIPFFIPPPEPVFSTETKDDAPKGISTDDPLLEKTNSQGVGEHRMDLETRIGMFWFNRIGLLLLVIGFALFSRQINTLLQPWHKVVILYLGSGLLCGVGRIWETKLQQFARPVMAGGLSLAFLTSYSAHFVPATACFPLTASLGAMLASVAAMLLCAERWRSQATAGLAILLGHAAILVAGHDAGSFTTIAIFALGATAVVLGVRHEWMRLNLVTVVAAFLTHTIWAVQPAGSPPSPTASFWLHFLSATAYYALFTFGGVRFVRRRARSSDSDLSPIQPDLSPSQRAAGRAVGPVALVLYVSFVAWLFRSTAVYQDGIQWFLFPLALVQGGLAYVHRRAESRDTQAYLAAGAVFLTLGLFAWLDGLTLNLALAAEALLLLILSRSLDLWLLNPVAQIVLVANFIHFWGSDVHFIRTWPAFLGSVATASVYFVKSRMEETWRIPDEKTRADWALPGWVERMRPACERLVRPLAHIHAAAGGILLSHASHTFFSARGAPLAFAGLIILLYVLIARVPCVPWIWGLMVLQFALIAQLAGTGPVGVAVFDSAAQLWLHLQVSIGGVLATSIAMVALARRSRILLHYLAGLLGVAAVPLMIFFASYVGLVSPPLAFACLVLPLAYWILAEWLPRPNDVLPLSALRTGPLHIPGMARRLARVPTRHLSAAIAGVLCNIVLLRTLPEPPTPQWVLVGIGCVGLAACVMRGSSPLGTGLVVLLILNLASLFGGTTFDLNQAWPPSLIWAMTFSAPAAAAGLSLTGIRQRRSSLVAAALILLAAGMAAIGGLLFQGFFTDSTLPRWLLTGSMFWLVIETYNRGLRKRIHAGQAWQDRVFLSGLAGRRAELSILYSVVGALLISGILHQNIGVLSTFWRAETVLAVLFAAGTALLRSPPLAAAGAACLLIAQGGQVMSGDGISHPLWTGVLIATTLAAGATSERTALHAPATWSVSARRALAVGGWYGALSTLGLGALVLQDWAGGHFSAPSLAWAAQLLIALPVAAVGTRFRLPRTAAAPAALVVWVGSATLFLAYQDVSFRPLLHVSAILMAVQTLGLERLLARMPDAGPTPPIPFPVLRQGLVIAGAMLLVAAFHSALEIRDAWTTLGWSVAALAYLALGFLFRFSIYRRVALLMFLASIVRIIAIDMPGLAPLYRIAAFLALGACLIGASFLYSRFRDEIRKWL